MNGDALEKLRSRLEFLLSPTATEVPKMSAALGIAPTIVRRWQAKSNDLRLSSVLKIVDYFGCSIEYLCGRTDTLIDYAPKPCPPFAEHLNGLLAERGITKYRLFLETPVNSSQFHYWTKGSEPRLSSLFALSEYLDISLDVLVGRDR